MDHWERTLPGRIYHLRYEEFLSDFETQAKRLIEHCGLPWDPACVEFHNSDRRVKTASASQVRQPLYTHSIERWRRYEKQLGPLLEVLGDIQNVG
jgi:hypothetical protein